MHVTRAFPYSFNQEPRFFPCLARSTTICYRGTERIEGPLGVFSDRPASQSQVLPSEDLITQPQGKVLQ